MPPSIQETGRLFFPFPIGDGNGLEIARRVGWLQHKQQRPGWLHTTSEVEAVDEVARKQHAKLPAHLGQVHAEIRDAISM